MSSEAKRLRAKVRQIELDLENTIQRLARTEDRTMITAYETRVVELKKESALIEEELARIGTPAHSFEEMFELSMRCLSSLYDIWEKWDLTIKKTALRLVFSSPLMVSRKTGVQTAETTYPFSALQSLERIIKFLGLPAGLEPATHRVETRRSIQLSQRSPGDDSAQALNVWSPYPPPKPGPPRFAQTF